MKYSHSQVNTAQWAVYDKYMSIDLHVNEGINVSF